MAIDLSKIIQAAAESVLEDKGSGSGGGKQDSQEGAKRGLTMPRAFLVGAGLYTAGKLIAGSRGRDMLENLQERLVDYEQRHFGSENGDDAEAYEDEEPEAEEDEDFDEEADEDEEPEAEEDEDFDEEYNEDEEPEAEEEEEPEAEEDEDFDEEYDEDEEPEAEEEEPEAEEDEEPEAEGEEDLDEEEPEQPPKRRRTRSGSRR